MTLNEDLLNLLTLHGIDTTKYTETMLSSLILEAKSLINTSYVYDSQESDYVDSFYGNKYLTDNYPLKEVTSLLVNGEEVTPRKVTHNGIIYFEGYISGTLEVEYVVGLDNSDFENTVLPICLYIAKDNEGKNVASISEGDVSISYHTNGNSATMIDTLITNIRNKYGARVRLL